MAIDERQMMIDELLKKNGGNTGVSGYGMPGGVETPGLDPGATTPPDIGAATSTPTPTASSAAPAASYAMRGFDAGKLAADPSQQSEKYKIGNVMKQFDPKAGVTPDMLAALNALDIAKFSGSGDKLTVENTKNDPRFGRGGTADVVYGLKGQNADTAWQPWFVDEGAAAGAPAMTGGAGMAGGSALQSIAPIASMAPTDTGFYQKLQDQLAQILGGPNALDRDALLKMLGA